MFFWGGHTCALTSRPGKQHVYMAFTPLWSSLCFLRKAYGVITRESQLHPGVRLTMPSKVFDPFCADIHSPVVQETNLSILRKHSSFSWFQGYTKTACSVYCVASMPVKFH
ncbi:hypothetical protein BDZ94DRAFT_512852 [Collybia nuda]|uniref:Uncharacterized protein n=1 Tax=Collybia nuda TaxID=64659 RepID=A0A9P6CJ91_9AGAR|nr:hypothetical protein BDZ94DRAFT_512852 [Collybia nuda]